MASFSATDSLHWLLRKIFSTESIVKHWNVQGNRWVTIHEVDMALRDMG